jgi:hypothetical protein
MFQAKFVEKIKTHILCSTTFFFENVAICEIMWKNIVDPDTPQLTLWRMRISCWVPKAINTQSEKVILIALPLQKWLYERVSMLRYSYIAFLVKT